MTNALFYTEGQFAKLYLAIHKPNVIMSAQVNSSFITLDDVTVVPFDNVTAGTYSDILPGMKVLFGSVAGKWDLGIARTRKAADPAVLYIGRQSDVQLANDIYITVIDDFWPCAKHWLVADTDPEDVMMDTDIAYSDQNVNYYPVPVMGPDAVLKLVSATVSHQRNASSSWVLDGGAITYSWAAKGPAAVTITGSTTATPTFTFSAPGEYQIALTVTANGKSVTGYRHTFVFGGSYLPVANFELETLTCTQNEGTSFRVILHDSSVLTGTYDQARVILFAEDVYGNTQQSFGPLVGYENVVSWGWADQNLVSSRPNHSSMTLDVKGPAYWMDQVDLLASGGLKSTDTTPTGWLYTQSLTVDKALHNLLHWRSTLSTIIDILPSNDVRVASGLVANNGSLWEQVKDIAGRIFITPTCDRYGRLCLSVDTQMIPYASRSSIATTMEITKADWRDEITITQRNKTLTSQVYLGATDNSKSYFSKAPGKIVLKQGKQLTKDNVLVSDQNQANQLSGDLLAWQNNQYPSVVIPLRANNRLIDVAPNQYVTLSMASTDTPLGIVWTNQKLIPRKVTYNFDAMSGAFEATVECECETHGVAGTTYTPPSVPVVSIPPGPGGPANVELPSITLPGFINSPRVPTRAPFWDRSLYLNNCKSDPGPGATGPYPITFSPGVLTYDTPCYGYLSCWVRPSSVSSFKTYMIIGFSNVKVSDILDELVVEAIDESNHVIMTATSIEVWGSGMLDNDIKIAFEPVVGTTIAGIKISLNPGGEGYGSSLTYISKQKWGAISDYAYLGNGRIYIGLPTDSNPLQCQFNFKLKYAGPTLSYGRLGISMTHLSGACTNEWNSAPGFHYYADETLTPSWGSTGGGRGPISLLATWTFGYMTLWTPPSYVDRYLCIGLYFKTITQACTWKINSIWWPDDNPSSGVNLWPYGTGVAVDTRRYGIANALLYNVCQP